MYAITFLLEQYYLLLERACTIYRISVYERVFFPEYFSGRLNLSLIPEDRGKFNMKVVKKKIQKLSYLILLGIILIIIALIFLVETML